MAEPVSLTVGIVSLASLFNTCIECFDLIDSGRNYGRDAVILLTRLDVEKTRFLIWGDAVGILESANSYRDPQIDCPQVRPVIQDVLMCIKMLFTDTDKLTSKYGLRQPRFDLSLFPRQGDKIVCISANGLNKFHAKYAQFLARIHSTQQETGMGKKAKWAIRDRDKFSVLIDDLKRFIDSLSQLAPATQKRQTETMKAEIESLPDESLRIIQDATVSGGIDYSEVATLQLDKWEMVTNWLESDVVEIGNEHNATASQTKLFAEEIAEPMNKDIKIMMVVSPDCDGSESFRYYGGEIFESSLDLSIVRELKGCFGFTIASTIPQVCVYCPPCFSLLNLALRICGEQQWTIKEKRQAPYYNLTAKIRIDERLRARCTAAKSKSTKAEIMDEFLVGNHRYREYIGDFYWQFLDKQYITMRQHLDTGPETEPNDSVFNLHSLFAQNFDNPNCVFILIFAESSQCNALAAHCPVLSLIKKPMKPGEVFEIVRTFTKGSQVPRWKPEIRTRVPIKSST